MDFPFNKDCIETCGKLKIFSLKENNKEFIAINKNQLFCYSIQIDGKIFKDDVKKCDKGLLTEDNRFYLVELKGCDVEQACKQLLITYEKFLEKYKNYNYYCRAIVANMPSKKVAPKLLGASYRKLQKKLGKEKRLVYKSVKLEEII